MHFEPDELLEIENASILKGAKLFRALKELKRLYEIEKEYKELLKILYKDLNNKD